MATAFDGEGAMQGGGRWNRPGTRVVYVSTTRSLALLETIVHFESAASLAGYTLVGVEFDAKLVEEKDPRKLPRNWRAYPAPSAVQELGTDWANQRRSAVLAVPSAVVPQERNYLLNPEHPSFAKIAVSKPEPIEFDPRLVGRRSRR